MREYQLTYTLRSGTPKTPEEIPRISFQMCPMHHLEHAGQTAVNAEENPYTPNSIGLDPSKSCASDILPMARGTLPSLVMSDHLA